MVEPQQNLTGQSSHQTAQLKFIYFSALFFILATVVFILAFSALRINALKAEQATSASVFISQLTSIVENTREPILDDLVYSFLSTQAGDRQFNCIELHIDSMGRDYSWPSENCSAFQNQGLSGLKITSSRTEDPPAQFTITAYVDEGAPIDQYTGEVVHMAVSALLMGLFALLAVNFAYNRAVRRPLKKLLDELIEALAGTKQENDVASKNDIQIHRFTDSYHAMIERTRELKRKEAFWRAITDSSFDSVISADSEGRIIDFNSAAENTFGYQRDQVIGLQIVDLIVPERYRNAHREGWERYLRTGEERVIGKTVEIEALKADGSEIQVELSVATIAIEGERYFTAYLRDVTEAKRTLEALKENEAMLNQSAKVAHLGYAVWDDILDKDVTVTEELARIHGFTRNEYIETVTSMDRYLELVVPEDREKYQDYEDQFTADDSGEAAGIEYRIMRSDGEIRYLNQRSQYLSDSSGHPTQSIIVIQDVTDQKQIEVNLKKSQAALEEREAMLIQSAEMANLGHAIWNYVGDNYIMVSESWAGIHGYTKQEYLARFVDLEKDIELIHPGDRERYHAYYENIGEESEIEYRVIRRDGETRHLLERHQFLIDEPGEPTKSLVAIQDITDRIERENELNEAKEAAEQGSIAKSSFLALMSHEIRTPLNAVLGALGLIDSKDLDPSVRKFLNVGRKGAESLLLIVNDILDFSKMEAGKLQLEPALFNVQKTIDDVLQVLEARALEKGISLTGELGPDVPEFLTGDAGRIRQVLLNLCSNAVRFTEKGGVHISLSTTGLQDGIAQVRFQVEDTGSGVSLEDQEHLFEEFWGNNTITQGHTGSTGLGLPISRQLVEMMGGSIDFESEPGRGSRFWLDLPLETPDEKTIKAEKNKPKNFKHLAPYEDLPGLQGRVLLAEDNPANQLIGQTILERIGLQVDVVANGHEVIDALRNVPYDMVLMDINMPEMDGIEATTAIRKLPGDLSTIPIIAMTALAMPGDRERILSQGMDDYVGKPIIREELHACITRVLKGL